VAVDRHLRDAGIGGVRAARDAAQADAAATAAGVGGPRLLVASEVARQYFVCDRPGIPS